MLHPEKRGYGAAVGRRIIRRQALASRIDGAAWNWLVRRLFDLPVGDVDCAFKLMRRDLVAELELVSDGRTINTELVAKSLLAGGRITEVGVRQLGEARSPASAGGLIADVRELLQLRGARQAGRLAPPER